LYEFSGSNYKKNIIIKVLIVLFYVLAIPFTILSGGLFSIVVVIGTIIIIKKVKKEKNKGKF
jgi:predicted membrane protein